MASPLPDDVRAVLDLPVFAHVGTINPDGSPHVSVVWIDRDGDDVVFSTAEGRVKPRNLRNDPRVSISLSPPDEPYGNIVLSGRAVVIEQAGFDLIDRLAKKYVGTERYEWATQGQIRVDVRVEIDHIAGYRRQVRDDTPNSG